MHESSSPEVPCGAEWSTDHDDSWYGLSATCDDPSGHAGKHSGPVSTWDGRWVSLQEGVRLEWPSS